jgi:hypothetical protein
MFSLGGGKETLVEERSTLELDEASGLLSLVRAQEQLLERAMNKDDMSLYEVRAQQISELLQQLTNG